MPSCPTRRNESSTTSSAPTGRRTTGPALAVERPIGVASAALPAASAGRRGGSTWKTSAASAPELGALVEALPATLAGSATSSARSSRGGGPGLAGADGAKIRLRGAVPARDGGPAGDVEITVRQLPDPRFERRGANLVTELALTLAEALLGAGSP